MEVADDQNKISFFVQFDEPRPVLVINSESVKPFVHAFERFKIRGWMEGIGEKQGFLFLKLLLKSEFLNLLSGFSGYLYLHTAEAQTWRQSCHQLPSQHTLRPAMTL
jgi:hypothetical protein